MNTLVISLLPEGATDTRFLSDIIIRTAFEILIEEADGQIDVSDVISLKIISNIGRDRQILQAAKESYGYHILIVHSDADDESNHDALENRINPGFLLVDQEIGRICKNLVAIIPIHMTEAWMIADKNALREEIGTDKTDEELELTYPLKRIEKITNPKVRIQRAIELACAGNISRRSRINISDLYLPLAQKIDLNILKNLGGYKEFRKDLRDALKRINYIH